MATSSTIPTGLDPVEATIYQTALQYGVDPRLALADAEVESGLDPTAVGDEGTSFGLYQLHEGGELGNLSPAEAFNPSINANTALSVFGSVAAANPGADPGLIAYLAERPANKAAYVSAVDKVYNSPSFLPQVPGGSSTGSNSSGAAGAQTTSVTGNIGGFVGDFIGGILGGATGLTSRSLFEILLEIAFVIASLALIFLGLARLFPGVTHTIVETAKTAAPLAAA